MCCERKDGELVAAGYCSVSPPKPTPIPLGETVSPEKLPPGGY